MDSAQRKIKENYLKKEPHIYIEPKKGLYFKENEKFDKDLRDLEEEFSLNKILETDGFYFEYKGKIIGINNVEKTKMPIGEIGKTYCFTVPQITLSPFGPTLKKICLEKEEEGEKVEVPLQKLQKLLGKENFLSKYQIFLKDQKEIKKIYEDIKKFLPKDLKIETIYDKKAPIFYALKIEKISMVLGVFLILFVSIFQLYFSLKLLFYHYYSSWALFKVFGFKLKNVKKIFKYFCFYIFFFSSFLGFLFSFIFIKLQNSYNFFPFPEEMQHFKYINYEFPFTEFFLIFLFLVFLSLILGEMIGSQTKNLNVQEILRVPQ